MHLAILDRDITAASDESIMDSASVIYRWAENGDELHRWSTYAQYARNVEIEARDFIHLRTGETAENLLVAALNLLAATSIFSSGNKSKENHPQITHLICAAAAHLASSEHPIQDRMRQALHPVRRQDADEIAGTVQSVWSEWVDEKLFDQVVEQAENERRLREEAEARIAAAHDKA